MKFTVICDGHIGLARETYTSQEWIREVSGVFSACSSRTATNYRDRDKNGHVRFITRFVRATHLPPTHVFSRAERRESRWNRKTPRGLNRRVTIKPVRSSLFSGKESFTRCKIIYQQLIADTNFFSRGNSFCWPHSNEGRNKE